jgi:hypothetical protein
MSSDDFVAYTIADRTGKVIAIIPSEKQSHVTDEDVHNACLIAGAINVELERLRQEMLRELSREDITAWGKAIDEPFNSYKEDEE